MTFGISVEKINQLAQKKKTAKIIPHTKAKDPSIRMAAIRALGTSGGDEAFNKLTQFLNSTNAQERAAAAEALGTLGRSQARSFLSYYIDRETDSNVVRSMKMAMGKLDQTK